jgi:hypothetical protein
MLQIDLGNIALAVAALGGILGWAVYFGASVSGNKPPKFEPEMHERKLQLVAPHHGR